MNAIVIGGGIGGLSCAIALRKVGWDVTVFEQNETLIENGAGIVLAANAMRALKSLDIAKHIQEEGTPIGVAELRSWDGNLLASLPVDKQAIRYGTPSYLIHRGKLQSILHSHCLHIGVSVHLGKSFAEVDENNDGVEVRFPDGTSTYSDLLIAADGYRSKIRDQLFGHSSLRYSGYRAIRGIGSFEDPRYPLAAGGGFEALGKGARFGFSHLGNGRIFWFAAINEPEGQRAHFTPEEHKKLLLQKFQNWYSPVPSVVEATSTSDILSHSIYDLAPLSNWSKGRITLLGDAAHPMLPNLGQGGAQAMEDAVVLADLLKNKPIGTTLVESLKAFEKLRIQRVSKIVRQSRLMGRLMQLESPLALTIRNAAFRVAVDKFFIARLHPVVGYDPPIL
ncbi:FAD-dependent monooxygenase [Paenibacillus sp. GSMTC-2017]|uniref:FAD-dependent monooxygenase n=1 Tax=Paenibacillus sp. GSMTC-2017 TaxID=2794350 RepID=UPI0018D7D6E8|nr:FAD-dependent monooxygenase [Paenibacillus sp. GSMTC-2017]MBH5317778.1 FAD-dependent monooxygenase [Paenibacillus sp. GSMTC-2017]